MAQKRLKDQIKEVKKELKDHRNQFASVALSETPQDLKLLDTIKNNIKRLEMKLNELEALYKK
jgi:archaellum component FlaC